MENMNNFPLPKNVDILQKAIDTYGKAAQVDMAIEEMSELTKTLLKERRAEPILKPDRALDIFEETADVIIMLCQILMIFDRYGNGLINKSVQACIDEKMERLERQLRKGNAE